MSAPRTYPGGWAIRRERVRTRRGSLAWRWRLERDGRLVAHYRTLRDAEAHGPKRRGGGRVYGPPLALAALVALVGCAPTWTDARQADAERAYVCDGIERGATPPTWHDPTTCERTER